MARRLIGGSRKLRTFAHIGVLATAVGSVGAPSWAGAFEVTTYHYDNLRTGWNENEKTLTPANVSSGTFGMLFSSTVDAQSGPHPLMVNGVHIAGAKHDVVYVVTTKNSVYAFDAISGEQLATVNLGAPPPKSEFPRPEQTGILSTPVIDPTAGLLYAITCTYENSTVVYRLHALDLSTLADKLPSVVIAASALLSNGQTVQFEASVQLQRPALLMVNGNIYAGFGSFGDLAEDVTRGWLLGWNASTLAPLPANELTNQQSSSQRDCQYNGPPPCFLTSIWMSGFGPAADSDGNIYFVTGNSDAGSYDPPIDIQESAVKVSGDLSQVLDYFTPSQHAKWDMDDRDFGSGGITLLPDQPGPIRRLAVVAGKSGTMYLLKRNNLGSDKSKSPDGYVTDVDVGKCWCGESAFRGSDGVGRVVSSGADKVEIWSVVTTPKLGLALDAVSGTLETGQDQGFLTSVSSNGTADGTAVVWAVGRPETFGGPVTLFAIDPIDGSTLFSAAIGSWPRADLNANLVPVVANGRVYVAVDTTLYAFGLGGKKVPVLKPAKIEDPIESNEVSGTVVGIKGTIIILKTRYGREVLVDASVADRKHRSADVFVGHPIIVAGAYDSAHTMHATLIYRAKDSSALWPSDK